MKIYRMRMDGDFGAAESLAVWFTRKADAPAIKRDLMYACHDAEVQPEPEVEQFDVPTDKAALVAFLNRHCAR